MIFTGFAAYAYLDTELPWGIILALMGGAYLVFKLGELAEGSEN